MVRTRLLLLLVGVLLATTLALAPASQAHAYLDASTPAPNGDVPVGKTVLALRFTEVIEPKHTTVRLEGSDGSTIATELDRPSDRPRVLRVEVDPLPAGRYDLRWSSFSVDSHVDHGTVPFTVGAGEDTLRGPVQAFDPGAQDQRLVVLETVGRLLFLGGALVAFGFPIYLSEVEPDEVPPRGSATLLLSSGLLGIGGVVLLLGIMTTRLEATPWVAAQTLPGLFLLAKAALLAFVVLLAHHARRTLDARRMRPLLICVVAGILALVLHSMSGHGVLEMTSRESAAGHVAMTLHLAASGLWAGGLAGLLLTVRGTSGLVERIRAFTPLAIVSVLAIGATGLVQAYVHLPSLAALWTSSFGWALVVKTSLLAAVLALGAWHGFGLPGRIEAGERTPGSFLGSGTAEILLLAGVVLAAAAMGALPVPADDVDASDGPLAVYEEERHLPNHELRLRILADPIRAGDAVPVDLTLEPTSSAGVGDTTVNATLTGPANRSTPISLEPTGTVGPADTARRWMDPSVSLPRGGTWTLAVTLDLPRGPLTEWFPVLVQASQETAGP